MGFAADLERICGGVESKVQIVIRKITLDLSGQIIDRSPVDTGRFKSNWMPGIGAMDGSTTATTDTSGGSTKTRIAAKLSTWKHGQAIWITNSLPYAYRLEYKGWSKQAPGGMVRLALQDTQNAVAKAAREVRA